METVRNPLIEIKQEVFDEILKTEPNDTFHDENQPPVIKKENSGELIPQDFAGNEFQAKEEFFDEEFVEESEYKHVITESNSSAENSETPNWCAQCSKIFNSKSDLAQHFRITDFKITPCSSIGQNQNQEFFFARKPTIMLHRLSQKFDKPYRCNNCHKRFKTMHKIYKHIRTHACEKPHACKKCGEKFFSGSSMRSHVCIKVKKTHLCKLCDKKFTFQTNLIRHVRSHTGGKPFLCDKCGKLYRTKDNLRIHNEYAHSLTKRVDKKTLVKCDICGKEFTTKSNLSTHKQTHTDEQKFQCECGKKFGTKHNFLVHKLSHTGEKNFACETCGCKFYTKSNLNVHLRTHTGDRPYPCQVCEKRFKTKTMSKYHMRIHLGLKPFRCEVCDRSFTTNQELKIHVLIHSDVAPFGCAECGEKFYARSKLRRHAKIHSVVAPFGCAECGERFHTKRKLKTHGKIHSNENQIKIEVLETDFTKFKEIIRKVE